MSRYNRIELVAQKLYRDFYETPFGGKPRGRFLIDRENLKRLLGVTRLRPETINELSDACLAQGAGLAMIDLDDLFAFCERIYLEKWRRIPQRLIDECADELNPDEQSDEPG